MTESPGSTSRSDWTRYVERLTGRIAAAPGSEGFPDFEDLAIELFRIQFDLNPAYRRLCGSAGRTRDSVRDWRAIPAAPTVAFKELELTVLPADARSAVFHSSGTTGQKPSRHFHCAASLAVYEASLRAWFEPHLGPGRFPGHRPVFVALTPRPDAAPHSSLVHMLEYATRSFGAPGSIIAGHSNAAGTWEVDAGQVIRTLERSAAEGCPVVLLGTAFNFVHLVDELDRRGMECRPAPGSCAMETGGYKGRSRTLARPDLHAAMSRCLGIPEGRIVSEYGMCELGSQAYDRAVGRDAPRRFLFPPWARPLVVSPETGRETAPGEPGFLRVIDLANVASVVAVQTEDLFARRDDGLELLGRAAAAEPRGCSLMAP